MVIGEEIFELATRTRLDIPDLEDQPVSGVDLNLPFVTKYRDHWELHRREDVSVDKLVAMRKTDGQARALYNLMTLPIMSALKGSKILPAGGKEGGTKEAEFIDQMLNLPPQGGGMEIPFRTVIGHFLLALFDGFSAAEMVVHSPIKGPLKDKWTIQKIAPRPAETITFRIDRQGQFLGFRQKAYIAGELVDEDIDKERALYFTANPQENPYWGVSYFRTSFWHWDSKIKLYYLAFLMIQRAAVGMRVGTYPKGMTDPKKIKKFIEGVSDVGTNQWVVIEEGFTIESLKEGSSTDALGLINHHNAMMSKSLLATFLDENKGAGANDGSFVDFGQESDALFQLMLDSIIQDLEDLINHRIIPWFIDKNFGTDMYPTFKWGAVSQDQRRMVVELFKTLMVTPDQGGTTKEFRRKSEEMTANALAMDIDYETTWARVDAEEAKQQKQEDQMNKLQLDAMRPQQPAMDKALGIPPDLLPGGFDTGSQQ